MITQEESRELVLKIRGKDPAAEEAFYSAYHASTLAMIRHLVREPVLAEDLVQETMLTVLLKLRAGKVEKAELLGRYVRQTARYTVIDWYRRKDNQWHPSVEEMGLCDERPGAEEAVFDDERRQIVASLLESMCVERDREVLVRRYLQDEDKSDICRDTALSSQHFDRVISRARKRCKALVAQKREHPAAALVSGFQAGV